MKRFASLSISLVLATGAVSLHGAEPRSPLPEAETSKSDPAMLELSRLVGNTWSNNDPNFLIENHYEWAFGGTAIRGLGIVGKGSPHESRNEAILGWDPVGKNTFYIDCHGGKAVYQGTVKKQDEKLIFEFATTVGRPSKWREEAKFTDDDTFQFTIYGEKEGKWSPIHSQTLKRKPAENVSDKLITGGIIDAPVDEVWAALCTKEGLESWNVAHAEVDLKVGGMMRTHYDPKGRIGDPNTIENTILSLEPNRMLSMRVANPPDSFPFKKAIKSVWQVIHFEPIGSTQTKVEIIGLGYGSDDESRKLRDFFDKGNAYTLKKLQEKFKIKAGKPANQG